MSLTNSENGMVMPVAPMNGYGYGNGGFGFGDGGGLFWLLVLFLFGFAGNGFGGFGGGNAMPYVMNNVDNGVQRGFDQQAVMTGITGLNNAVSSGFANVQTGLCSGFGGVTQAVTNGFAQAEIAANARQIADMQQQFAAQTASSQGMNNLQSQLAQCCCDNRLATADLQSVIQTEACADRQAVNDALRDLLTAQTAGFQSIKDMMCQDKIDAKNEKIAELQNQLNMASFAASQASQDNYLQNALTAQTQYFLSLYPPTAAAARTNTQTTGA